MEVFKSESKASGTLCFSLVIINWQENTFIKFYFRFEKKKMAAL